MLVMLIRAYQRFGVVQSAVKTAIAVHHRIIPATRKPCPYAGHCSATALSESWSATEILSRMSKCGGALREWDDCDPKAGLGCHWQENKPMPFPWEH